MAENLKRKRFDFVFNMLANNDLEIFGSKISLLDVGCNCGKDFLRFLFNNERFNLYGIDVYESKIEAKNLKFILMDAEKIDFPDNFFDITISIGTLEHIQPIEKLSKVISEINRVSKSYYIAVPCIATLIEPHTLSPLWQLRDHNKKSECHELNYFSDDVWLKFQGFKDARTLRHNYLSVLKQDLWIFKTYR